MRCQISSEKIRRLPGDKDAREIASGDGGKLYCSHCLWRVRGNRTGASDHNHRATRGRWDRAKTALSRVNAWAVRGIRRSERRRIARWMIRLPGLTSRVFWLMWQVIVRGPDVAMCYGWMLYRIRCVTSLEGMLNLPIAIEVWIRWTYQKQFI